MGIVDEYVVQSPSRIDNTKPIVIDSNKSCCIKLLETLTEACPGLGAALLLMGKVKMQIGDLNGLLN